MRWKTMVFLLPVMFAAPVAPVAAQGSGLTLAEALSRADGMAYANRIASGQAETASSQSLAALRGVLPTVRIEGGWARTTDPIGAFGTTLRQRSITQADFDPARLNDPEAIANYTGALVLEQPLFNADAHLGRTAASKAAAAAAANVDWTRSSTRLDVIRAWFGAVLATERVATLEAAVEAAAGHVRQTESMLASGAVTRSDVLLARVKAGEMETELISARGDASLAGRELAVLLGMQGDTAITVPARLPAITTVHALLDQESEPVPAPRADVRAAQLGLAAARSGVNRARSLYLPRINAFARFDWNSASRPYAGKENWSAGIMATWTPFAGASQLAEARAASGREEAARAGAEAAEANAKLEIRRTGVRRAVARERLAIAEDAMQQSVEAHRIVARKYDGGLATVVELLDASAVETRSGLGLSFAIYEAIVAVAEWRQARGLGLEALAGLDTEQTGNTR